MFQTDFNRPSFNGHFFGTTPTSFVPSYYPLALGSSEIGLLQQRVDTLCAQLNQLTDIVLRKSLMDQQAYSGLGTGYGIGAGHSVGSTWTGMTGVNAASGVAGQTGWATGPIFGAQRIRESESNLFWEICAPTFGTGDIDVEVSGNRVICRTRVPVRMGFRTLQGLELSRGIEIFELPDGRIEFNWLVPVSFISKDVEASCTDGRIVICVPKAEVSSRHTVKVTKETVRKNGSHEMTA